MIILDKFDVNQEYALSVKITDNPEKNSKLPKVYEFTGMEDLTLTMPGEEGLFFSTENLSLHDILEKFKGMRKDEHPETILRIESPSNGRRLDILECSMRMFGNDHTVAFGQFDKSMLTENVEGSIEPILTEKDALKTWKCEKLSNGREMVTYVRDFYFYKQFLFCPGHQEEDGSIQMAGKKEDNIGVKISKNYDGFALADIHGDNIVRTRFFISAEDADTLVNRVRDRFAEHLESSSPGLNYEAINEIANETKDEFAKVRPGDSVSIKSYPHNRDMKILLYFEKGNHEHIECYVFEENSKKIVEDLKDFIERSPKRPTNEEMRNIIEELCQTNRYSFAINSPEGGTKMNLYMKDLPYITVLEALQLDEMRTLGGDDDAAIHKEAYAKIAEGLPGTKMIVYDIQINADDKHVEVINLKSNERIIIDTGSEKSANMVEKIAARALMDQFVNHDPEKFLKNLEAEYSKDSGIEL